MKNFYCSSQAPPQLHVADGVEMLAGVRYMQAIDLAVAVSQLYRKYESKTFKNKIK